MLDKVCPSCGARRVRYISSHAQIIGENRRCACGWWVCLDCWLAFDGAVDDPRGQLPSHVRRAEKKEEN